MDTVIFILYLLGELGCIVLVLGLVFLVLLLIDKKNQKRELEYKEVVEQVNEELQD